jgi:hypothetical protein
MHVIKEKKKLSGARKPKQVGTEGPELAAAEMPQSTPEEIKVRRVSGNTAPHWSLNLEIPATTRDLRV